MLLIVIYTLKKAVNQIVKCVLIQAIALMLHLVVTTISCESCSALNHLFYVIAAFNSVYITARSILIVRKLIESNHLEEVVLALHDLQDMVGTTTCSMSTIAGINTRFTI